MKNEVLIIPDIHGWDFWKRPCNEWDGIIIFLGDYVDPYYPTTQAEALDNLKELVEFSKNTKCTCKFLIGNHDFSYLTGFAPCRFNGAAKDVIKSLIEELNPIICTYIKGNSKTYLFSHAGITNAWLGNRDYMDKEFTTPNGYKELTKELEIVPISRGGNSDCGSCIWNDIYDFEYGVHNEGVLENTFQIFGHTWGGRTEPFIGRDYAMLDCHKAFILNLNTGQIENA